MRTHYALFLFLCLAFGFTSCKRDKADVTHTLLFKNETSYKLWVVAETSEDTIQTFVGTEGNAAYLTIFSASGNNVGDLGSWNEAEFATNLKKISIQRWNDKNELLDSIPKDFRDFKNWKMQRSKGDDFVSGLYVSYNYFFFCTEASFQ